jgi:Domain of unknown function (DUF4403)
MLRSLLLILAVLGLSACSFDAAPPHRTPAPPTPRPPLSTIAATLSLPQTAIAQILNDQTRDHIADIHDQPVKCGIGTCHLDLLARRAGPISADGGGNTLNLSMPFTGNAQLSAPGFLSALHAKADINGQAATHTLFDIAPDWHVRAQTTGEVHLEGSHLRIGPLVTNLASIWNGNEGALSRPLWQTMDRQLAAVSIRPQVAGFWTRLFAPIQVGRKPLSWLLLRPEKVRVARPVLENGRVNFSLSLEMRGQVIAADQPPPNSAAPLPPAARLERPSNAFAVAVPVLLTYDDAARLALAPLVAKPPRVAGMTVRFSKLKILPSGSDVVVEAGFCIDPAWDSLGWLASCGTGYLRGVPQFDAARGTIKVAQLHYDVESAGLMLKLLHWLAGDALVTALAPHLVFDESKEIARLDKQVTDALAKPQGGPVAIWATIKSFGAPAFTWTQDGFVASFSATGTTATVLQFQ